MAVNLADFAKFLKNKVSNLINHISGEVDISYDDAVIYQIERIYRESLDVSEFLEISMLLADAAKLIRDNITNRTTTANRPQLGYVPSLNRTGRPGRPSYDLPKEQLEYFIENDFTAKEIASLFHVSRSTIHCRLQEFGICIRQKFSDIDDEILDSKVLFCLQMFPSAGYKTVQGYLTSERIQVQRARLRESMLRVDPQGRKMYSLRKIKRRVYRVKGPLSLWHIDGNHKLIRWQIVVHGAVDGFSRMIVYLKANNNNRASTVLDLFQKAVLQYGLPARVRGDQGVENRDVSLFMLSHPRRGSGTFITGRSVHNTRIERLWRDIFEGVLCQFYDIFVEMEARNILVPDDDVAMFCLHYVFLPRVNQMLSTFCNIWNHHKIRTAGNKTPVQLFLSGMHSIMNDSSSVSEEYFEDVPQNELALYGVDPDAPPPDDKNGEDSEGVVVHAPSINEDIQLDINPLDPNDRWGINTYQRVLQTVRQSIV